MNSQDGSGDVPLDYAKRTGNPNSFLRAGSCCLVIKISKKWEMK